MQPLVKLYATFGSVVIFTYFINNIALETSKAVILAKVRVLLVRNLWLNSRFAKFITDFRGLETSTRRLDDNLVGRNRPFGHCGHELTAVNVLVRRL